MKWVWLVAAIAVVAGGGGCDQLFKLTEVPQPTPDAEMIDAPPGQGCTASDPFGTTCRTLTVPVSADTYLSPDFPNTPLGQRDAVHISSTMPGLFKFDTSAFTLGERISHIVIHLNPLYGTQAKDCVDGVTCGPCTSSIGAWHLHWTITGWSQNATTYMLADTGVPWIQPGATAIPQDRSPEVASGAATTAGELLIDVSPEQLMATPPECYRSAQRLGVLITIDEDARFYSSEGTLCTSPPPPGATADITVCK